MAHRVAYSIVDCADGRFAVIAVAASGATYQRGGLLTLADAEACVEDLRVALAGCGVALVNLDRSAETPEA
jgi:hypothetical protein